MLGNGDVSDGSRKFNSKNENPWMMKKYSPRMLITTFASSLSLGGMLGSLVFIIGSLVMILMAKIYCEECEPRGLMYGIGFPALFLSFGLKYYCIQLWKAIRNNNMDGLIFLVKIGNFILSGFEVLACVALTTTCSFLQRNRYCYVFVVIAVITAIYILLTFLKIFGSVMLKPGFIKASLLFNFFTYIIAVVLTIISLYKKELLVTAVMMFLLTSCIYIYFNCFIVLLYNIMLEEKMRKESTKWEMVEMDGSIISNPPPTAPRQKIENEYCTIMKK